MAQAPRWEPAYCEFFEARRSAFLRIAYAMLGNWSAAEDAAQQTFTALYARWPRISPDKIEAYARRVLVNNCIGVYRMRDREVLLQDPPTGSVWEDHDERLALLAALTELTARDRAVLALRFLEDLSVAEVAVILDVPEGTREEPDLARPRPPPDQPAPEPEGTDPMNVAERYRSTIDELTQGRPGGPELADVLTRGRRRRRARRTLLAVGAVGALTVAGLGGAWMQRPHEVVAVDPYATSPSYRDFVPGTGVDETIQAAVASHVAGVPDADKVYPSDWNHDTAIPDAEAQNATDWEAAYPLGAHESLTVSIFKPIPGNPSATRCRPSMEMPGLPCSATTRRTDQCC